MGFPLDAFSLSLFPPDLSEGVTGKFSHDGGMSSADKFKDENNRTKDEINICFIYIFDFFCDDAKLSVSYASSKKKLSHFVPFL